MRLVTRFGVTLGLVLVPLASGGERKGNALEVPGLFSVETPGKEFYWKAVDTKENRGVKADFFLCSNADASARMVLIMERRAADTEAKRSATIKANWNSLAALQQQGFKELTGKRPSLATPILDKVYYSMSGKGPDGSPVYIRGATVFGKNTYSFQALARTAAESERLIGVVKSLKESK